MNPALKRRELLGAFGALGLAATSGLTGCASAARGIADARSESPIANLAQGRLRGRQSGGVMAFKRIPYAPNPFLTENRFLAPKAPMGWSGVREADAFGPMPSQLSRAPGGGLAGAPDDLTLNIWAPASASASGGLPVAVWLPGGGFIRCDASEGWYDGSAFARDGVVLVSLNYRVGIDGFMAVDGGAANCGLLDQIAALQWVRANIAVFGGNPHDVTLMGQSAGAQSVLTLLGMPQADGLFRRGIAQSPAVIHYERADAERIARATAERLQAAPTREAMSQVPLPALIGALEAMVVDLRDAAKWGPIADRPPYLPVLDGDMLRQSPLVALRTNAPRNVATLIGCTDEEMRLYFVPGGAIDRIPQAAAVGLARGAGLSADAVEVYRKARPGATSGDLFAALYSDKFLRMPSLRYAENRAHAGAPVWFYEFAWKSPAFGGRLGAAHVLDVSFVFDTLNSEQARPFVGTAAPQELANAMHAAWVRFIKTGNPGWPAYDLTRRPTMRFDVQSTVVDDPGAAERELWAGVSFD